MDPILLANGFLCAKCVPTPPPVSVHAMVDTALHRIAEFFGRADRETETFSALSPDVGPGAERDGDCTTPRTAKRGRVSRRFVSRMKSTPSHVGNTGMRRRKVCDETIHYAWAVPRFSALLRCDLCSVSTQNYTSAPVAGHRRVKSVVARRVGFG
jgi:hypothetical protein